MPRKLTLFVAVWILFAAGLKAWRYSQDLPGREGPRIALATFVESEGWRLAAKSESANGDGRLIFQKPGCSAKLTILFFGPGAETAQVVRDEFNRDVAYFQDERSVSEPQPWRQSASSFAKAFGARLGQRPAAAPLFAVSPAPQDAGSECAGPSLMGWKNFLSNSK